MKYTVAVAALAATASATAPSKVVRDQPNVVARQVAVVTGVLNQVGSSISSLDSAVKAYTSGPGSAVISGSEALVATLNKGVTTITGSQELSLVDAAGLAGPVNALAAAGTQLTNDLNSKKSAIEANGLCETTRTQITNINTASNALIKATTAKVPADAQSIAQSLAAPLVKVLQQAQDDFSSSNCVDKSGSGGGSSSSSAPASSAPASSAPASGYPTSAATTAATTPASSGYVAPTTTMASSTPATNGTAPTTSAPAVTAGAAVFAPAGFLAVAVAAALF